MCMDRSPLDDGAERIRKTEQGHEEAAATRDIERGEAAAELGALFADFVVRAVQRARPITFVKVIRNTRFKRGGLFTLDRTVSKQSFDRLGEGWCVAEVDPDNYGQGPQPSLFVTLSGGAFTARPSIDLRRRGECVVEGSGWAAGVDLSHWSPAIVSSDYGSYLLSDVLALFLKTGAYVSQESMLDNLPRYGVADFIVHRGGWIEPRITD